MANRLPPPNVAVVPTCQACGQTVYCGGGQNPQGAGPQCPSATLPLPPDQVPMVKEGFQSVTVWNYQDGQVTMVQENDEIAFRFDDGESTFDDQQTAFDEAMSNPLRVPGTITQVA